MLSSLIIGMIIIQLLSKKNVLYQKEYKELKNSLELFIEIKKNTTEIGRYSTLQEAIKARAFFIKEKDRLYYAQEPTLNNAGSCIVKTSSDVEIIVDRDLWHELNKITWNLDKNNYSYGTINKKIWKMHRYIMSLKDPSFEPENTELVVDHINNNRLDNRFINLKIATFSQNAQNRVKRANTTSKYVGVYKAKHREDRYVSRITINGKKEHLGTFDTEKAAAYAYNKRLVELDSDKNFKEQNLDVNKGHQSERILSKMDKASKYYGVKRNGKNGWRAGIQIKGETFRLGTFYTEEEAAQCYNDFVLEKLGPDYKYFNKNLEQN